MQHRLTSENNPLIYVRRRHSSKRKPKQHKATFLTPPKKEECDSQMTTPPKDPILRNAEIALLRISSHEQLHRYEWSKEMRHSHPSRVNFLTLLASSIEAKQQQHHSDNVVTDDKSTQCFVSPVKQASSVFEGSLCRNQTATPERRNAIKQRSMNRGGEIQFTEEIPYNFMISHHLKGVNYNTNNRLYQSPNSAILIADKPTMMYEGRANLQECLVKTRRNNNMQENKEYDDYMHPRMNEECLFRGSKTISFSQNRRFSCNVSKIADRQFFSEKKEQQFTDNYEPNFSGTKRGFQEQNSAFKSKQNWISSPSGSILVGVNMNISPFDITISDQFLEDKMIPSTSQMKEQIIKSDHLDTDQLIQYTLNRKKNEETILKSIENITHRKVQYEEQQDQFQDMYKTQNSERKKMGGSRKEQQSEKLAVMFNNGEWEMSEIKGERSINIIGNPNNERDRRFTSLNFNQQNDKNNRAVTADNRYNRFIRFKKPTTAQRNMFVSIQQNQTSKNSITKISEQLSRFNRKNIYQ